MDTTKIKRRVPRTETQNLTANSLSLKKNQFLHFFRGISCVPPFEIVRTDRFVTRNFSYSLTH